MNMNQIVETQPAHRRARIGRKVSNVLFIASLLFYPLTLLAVNLFAPDMANTGFMTTEDNLSDIARLITYFTVPVAMFVRAFTTENEAEAIVLVLLVTGSLPTVIAYHFVVNMLLR